METWKIRQIFDGDYGCEERLPGQEPKVSVTLVNEAGEVMHGIPIVFPSQIKYNTTYTSPEKTHTETGYVRKRLSEKGKI